MQGRNWKLWLRKGKSVHEEHHKLVEDLYMLEEEERQAFIREEEGTGGMLAQYGSKLRTL